MVVTVCLDLTRMCRRLQVAAATGIDRWELEVAQRMVGGVPGIRMVPVVQVAGRLRQLPGGARLVARAVRQWSDGQPPSRWPVPWPLLGRTRAPVTAGDIYLNLAHQGLDQPELWKSTAEAGLRPIVYLHDLIPIQFPETTRPEQSARHQSRLRHAIAQAHMILCPSTAVREDIQRFTKQIGCLPPRLERLPPGLQSRGVALPVDPAERRARFVILGTLEPRKGHDLLPQIWSCWTTPADRPELHVLGQLGWQGEAILSALRQAPALHNRLNIDLGPSDRQVTERLRSATGLLMPSLAEGWGIPVAEALSMGVPALVRDLPVYAETGQGLATLLPSPSQRSGAEAWHKAMAELSASPRRIESYRAESWDTALTPLWDLLRGSL